MGKSLDFSSSFFLSLSPVLCVFVYWHTQQRLTSLTLSSACTNGRLMIWLDLFYFRKPMAGGGRPIYSPVICDPQQPARLGTRSPQTVDELWSCCCCSPVSVYIVYSLSNVAQTQLLFPRSEPGCGCPAASRPSVYFAPLYRSHFISRNNRATPRMWLFCFETVEHTFKKKRRL
jgi:hypothetical protein